MDIKELKVDDKVIMTQTSYGQLIFIRMFKIIRVNKTTYKLSNEDLIYKDNFRIRGGSGSGNYASRYSSYQIFTNEAYGALNTELHKNKIEKEIKKLSRSFLDIKLLREAVEIYIAQEQAKDLKKIKSRLNSEGYNTTKRCYYCIIR